MKWIDVSPNDQARLAAELDQVATLVRNVKDPRQIAIMVMKTSMTRGLLMAEQARNLGDDAATLISYLAEECERVSCLYETL